MASNSYHFCHELRLFKRHLSVMMYSLLYWLCFLRLLHFAAAIPAVSFPFNAQLPPVARIGQLYSYSFSSYTFKSDENITYTLRHGPSWLSLESKTRRLYGIPDEKSLPPDDIIGQSFQIIATDNSGSVPMDCTIVISRESGPVVKIPASKQMPSFGDYSAPSSILSYPSIDFSYSFDSNTFQRPDGGINYYAVSGNSSPLPSWIKFDASTLSFSGRTPAFEALHQPPQAFDVRLVASDVVGFSSASIDFSIVVGTHKLTTDRPAVTLNATRGSPLKYFGLVNDVKIDNEPANLKAVGTSVVGMPDWLSFDSHSWSLRGTPKKNDHSTNFTIQFTDSFSDALEVAFQVNVASGLFKTTLDDIDVTPGEDFDLDLAPHFKNAENVKVNIETDPRQDWLHLEGLGIKGHVPESMSGDLEIRIEATSGDSGIQETESLHMSFLSPDGSATKTSATPTDSPRETDGASEDKDSSGSTNGKIGKGGILLATVVPIVAVAFLIMILVWCMRNRRMKRSAFSKNNLRGKISKPILGSLRVTGSSYQNGAMTNMTPTKKNLRTEKGVATHLEAQNHSGGSSETLGSLSSGVNATGYQPLRDAGDTRSEAERESWFTVERMTTALRSQVSTRSRASSTTGPRSTHQLLPTPPFLSHSGESTFRNGLELTIPSLDELPTLHLDPDGSSPQKPRSTAMYSSITSSSAALPSSRHNSPKIEAADITTATSTAGALTKVPEKSFISDKDWSTIADSEDENKVPELPKPTYMRISSHEWMGQRPEEGPNRARESTDRVKSFTTETSFGSSENWRVIGRYDRNAPLNQPAPLRISTPNQPAPLKVSTNEGESSTKTAAQTTETSEKRPATAGPVLEETSKQEKVKDRGSRSVSRSRYSVLNLDEPLRISEAPPLPPDWRLEESAKGSLRAFI